LDEAYTQWYSANNTFTVKVPAKKSKEYYVYFDYTNVTVPFTITTEVETGEIYNITGVFIEVFTDRTGL